MRPSAALALRRTEVLDLLGRFRAGNPRVFGSVARGEDRDGSDLDRLIDAAPGTTLFDLARLHNALSDLLGVPVDIATMGGMTPRLMARVQSDLKPL
ncbi:nucleotidyltransferase family protein [Sandaracinobacteroides saxicola]|uniref:Nucleotidyltransferase family protein n=1 Tax=Sandaracinobacteroides saxicola TaxID=2759707 RepID=A0A7G5II45_9SPHN|nr:nucleotidyltransferase family protein [Sandaracinobacteroides saxicola]QMW23037.1 nucleotidyltransferase family protein [Sandaracinobacteroides saxicola]